MKLVHWLAAISFFTASFDVLFIIHVGGTLRLCQLAMLGICIAAFARIIQEGRILWPRGSNSLSLWMFVQLIFIPLSGVMSIGLQFFGLLLFTVLCVFAMVQLYGDSDQIESLLRIYLLSYVFVAIVGLITFILPLVGLPSFLVQQWIVHGRFARISGFSYEPSFFATYLTMGWIMLVELRISNAKLTQGKAWKWATILVTAGLFLSTSKTAWVFMALEVVLRLTPHVWRISRRLVREMKDGRILIRIPGRSFLRSAVILLVLLLVGIRVVTKLVANPIVFLGGTGIAGAPAHSLDTRVTVAVITYQAYKEHPFIGRSLGGVSIYLASRNGIEVTTMEGVRQFWGFPVLMDVLVASGLFGFIPFLVFLYANTFAVLRVAKLYWPEERARWVRALARAMIFEWLLLMVDQNLLRTYLWFHISMVAVVTYHLEHAAAPAHLPHPQSPPPFLGDTVAAL